MGMFSPHIDLDSNYSLAEGIIIKDQLERWEFNSRILCYYLHMLTMRSC